MGRLYPILQQQTLWFEWNEWYKIWMVGQNIKLKIDSKRRIFLKSLQKTNIDRRNLNIFKDLSLKVDGPGFGVRILIYLTNIDWFLVQRKAVPMQNNLLHQQAHACYLFFDALVAHGICSPLLRRLCEIWRFLAFFVVLIFLI